MRPTPPQPGDRFGRLTLKCRSRRRIPPGYPSHDAKNQVHGATGTRLHNIWRGMKQRCSDPGLAAWKYYGGKGIRVCAEWQDFAVFRDWALANGYRPDLTIERINPDGDYEPNNCEFITWSENSKRALSGRWHSYNQRRAQLRDTANA